MMETLQQILHRLRPIGLEEFGLVPSLRQLIAGWNQRSRETRFTLAADEGLEGLPDNINVSVLPDHPGEPHQRRPPRPAQPGGGEPAASAWG
jgi:hypothetical protein